MTLDFFWLLTYFLVLLGMAGYGFHRLLTLCLYFKHRKDIPQPKAHFDELPAVTVQLPMFNEKYVVKGLLEHVAALDYPKDKLEIQILDDSTDDTAGLCFQYAEDLRKRGYDAVCLHRTDRTGFKAGALEEATKVAKGEYLLILDADFRPNPDLLQKTIHFFTDDQVALVQTRWGHMNRDKNLLTHLQSIFLDGHFALEQTMRNRSGRYFTFNGTAGIWRKQAIIDGGGWEHDTLTEDMDLSYRVQMKGWHFVYLKDYVTPAELPENMDGFKAQQHRWTKGSIQVCRKMLFDIWKCPSTPFKAKMEATTHLTANYAYLLLILLCVLVAPLATGDMRIADNWQMLLVQVTLFFFATVCVSAFYIVSQYLVNRERWIREILYIPFLLALGVGMAVNNAKAVLEAVFGHQSSFVRTPKFGVNDEKSVEKKTVGGRSAGYQAIKSFIVPLLELTFGLFFLYIIGGQVLRGDYISAVLMSPFLGFFYTSACSFGRMIANKVQSACVAQNTGSL